jgi:hypothetical protein
MTFMTVPPLGNYLAGHAKKSLRLSRAKDVLESGVFLKLPVELQLQVRTTSAIIIAIVITHNQVLEHLHPLDLYHVSLVSKFLRKVILHPKALGVWKAAFLQHPDLPPPPLGVKESDWAFMIYGPGICGVCLNSPLFLTLFTSSGTAVWAIWRLDRLQFSDAALCMLPGPICLLTLALPRYSHRILLEESLSWHERVPGRII